MKYKLKWYEYLFVISFFGNIILGVYYLNVFALAMIVIFFVWDWLKNNAWRKYNSKLGICILVSLVGTIIIGVRGLIDELYWIGGASVNIDIISLLVHSVGIFLLQIVAIYFVFSGADITINWFKN